MAALLLLSIHGVVMAPHHEGEPTRAQLERMVDEVREIGATHLQVVVQWGQPDVTSVQIQPYQWGTDDAQVREVSRYARKRGLKVLIFPILRVKTLGPGRWRGTLRPSGRAAWWWAYRRFILHYAALAEDVGAELFSVGSELSSMERDEQRWRALVADVRARYGGSLVYSANWDHFPQIRFWDALDYVGLNAYHPITDRDDASLVELSAAWRMIRDKLLVWLAFVDRPLLFTEVGYPSIDGGARRPYHHGSTGPVDLEEQRRAYVAFCDAWREQPGVAGAFFWIWSGEGGPTDNRYTPRGKPAEQALRVCFQRPA